MIDPTEYLLASLMGTGVNRATAEQVLAEHDAAKGAALLRQLADEIQEKATPAGAGTETTPQLIVFRASHDAIVMGLYTTAAAAREHCEAEVRREHAESSEVELWWREDEDTVDQPEDGEAELFEHVKLRALPGPGRTRNTGYVVTPLEVASAYDEEVDE